MLKNPADLDIELNDLELNDELMSSLIKQDLSKLESVKNKTSESTVVSEDIPDVILSNTESIKIERTDDEYDYSSSTVSTNEFSEIKIEPIWFKNDPLILSQNLNLIKKEDISSMDTICSCSDDDNGKVQSNDDNLTDDRLTVQASKETDDRNVEKNHDDSESRTTFVRRGSNSLGNSEDVLRRKRKDMRLEMQLNDNILAEGSECRSRNFLLLTNDYIINRIKHFDRIDKISLDRSMHTQFVRSVNYDNSRNFPVKNCSIVLTRLKLTRENGSISKRCHKRQKRKRKC